MPALTAVLVNVQLQFPTTKNSATANFADPIAIVAGLTMLLFVFRESVAKTLWRIPHFNLALGLMVATVVIGFFHGWSRFGLTDWALYNRLVGLGIVLGYLLTGALATAAAGDFGTRTLVRALTIASAAVVFGQWISSFFMDQEPLASIGWHHNQFSSLLGNRNAFAMVVLLALAASVTSAYLWRGRRGSTLHAFAFGLLAWGIYFSGSRGVVLAAIALLVFLVAIPKCRKPLLRLIAGAIVAASMFFLAEAVADLRVGSAMSSFGRFSYIQSDCMASLIGGLRMWFDHPLFGGGLGAFMAERTATTGIPLVIHNSFLWLMAEFGVVDLIAFLAALGLIVVTTLRTPRWTTDWSSVAVIAFILVLAVVSLTHDMAYQRVFWLLIGALVARPGALKVAFKNRSLAARHEAP